ncbi:MAG TPA: DUF120 domain-containing protein [Candidatus Thermoplasmatota archaeon]|nr:DUF120 domain-containing protein [Candidatus Thermoplasmatota archaeon]
MTLRERETPDDVLMLKALAKLGGVDNYVAISSGELAKQLGMSQQTASRRILDLLHKGLIVRRMGMRRQLLRLSPSGVEILRREAADYKLIFERSTAGFAFRGTLVAGLGEGQYYMSRRGYRDAFQRLLGFEPHPGTLNLRLSGADLDRLQELRAREGLAVPEFTDENRTFGAVKCFSASIQGVPCAVVLPARSHHEGILEVVSPYKLRDKLNLKDGDEVLLAVEPTATRAPSRPALAAP